MPQSLTTGNRFQLADKPERPLAFRIGHPHLRPARPRCFSDATPALGAHGLARITIRNFIGAAPYSIKDLREFIHQSVDTVLQISSFPKL